MDVNSTRPGPDLASLTASALQNTRFKERRLREAQSDVRNEAIYSSPVLRIDNDTQTVILQYRDISTGEIEIQYPSKKQMQSYTQAQMLEDTRSEAALEAVDKEITKDV